MPNKTQFKVNLPDDVKAWLEKEAGRNLRSLGSEIVFCLREKMAAAENPKP